MSGLTDSICHLSIDDLGSNLAGYAADVVDGLNSESPFRVIVGQLSTNDPAREAAMSTATNRGMRFIDNDNIDQISYEDIGPNDFVYLHTRVEKSQDSVDSVYHYIGHADPKREYNPENKQRALDAVWANEKFYAASGGTMSPEMGVIRDRLLKQAKAGAGMTRLDVDDEAAHPGTGMITYHRNMGCALVVEVNQTDPRISSALRGRACVYGIEPQAPDLNASNGAVQASFHDRLSAARKTKTRDANDIQPGGNSPRIR